MSRTKEIGNALALVGDKREITCIHKLMSALKFHKSIALIAMNNVEKTMKER